MIWWILAGIGIAYLLFSGPRQTAAGGGLVIGAIVGCAINAALYFDNKGLDWSIILKAAIAGVILGIALELSKFVLPRRK